MILWIIYALLLALLAYCLGSFPTGYLMGKLLRGIDIRNYGSKSTGATNVLRTLGKGPAIAVLAIDVFKGILAILCVHIVYFLPSVTSLSPNDSIEFLDGWRGWMKLAAGLLVVIGHSRPIWLGFKGGKSAATGLGVLYALHPLVGLGTTVIFAGVLAVTRIVSLGSISAALGSVGLMLIFRAAFPSVLFAIMASIYVTLRHRANIQRMLAGTEPKIGQKHQEN
jgi:acyl phosphate:glycerol-3-phosphate acyltransferase